MKRWVLVFLLVMLSYVEILAQSDLEIYKDIIVPGSGVAEITIGTPSETVFSILGKKPVRRSTFEEEKQTLLSRKLNPKNELVFFLGFDYVVEYDSYANRTYYPIYTIYFKDEKVVYMILSSYGYDQEKCKNFGISGTFFFGDGREKMQNTLGRSYISTTSLSKDLLFDYFSKGISIFMTKNQVRTMYIYPPLDKRMQRKFLAGR